MSKPTKVSFRVEALPRADLHLLESAMDSVKARSLTLGYSREKMMAKVRARVLDVAKLTQALDDRGLTHDLKA